MKLQLNHFRFGTKWCVSPPTCKQIARALDALNRALAIRMFRRRNPFPPSLDTSQQLHGRKERFESSAL